MALMLRSLASSLSSERAQGCIDPVPPSRTSSHRTEGGKVKRTPEPVRASPYPPLKRSSPGFGSGSNTRRPSTTQPLKRTSSLHGGDSLASLQRAATEARQSSFCNKPTTKHRRQTNGPLRSSLSLANTLILDPLVCPPPVPLSRPALVHAPVISAPRPPTPTIISQPSGVRRRSSLAPESGPTALVPRTTQVPLPSPPCVIGGRKKRESLAQRTLRRQFERTPRGAQVKVHGAHAAVRLMSEAEEEAAVAAVVVVEQADAEDVCMSDSWVQVPNEEMEWTLS